MLNFKQLQKDIFDNKVTKGFNTTDVDLEFCLTYGELAEAYNAYSKKLPDLSEELADVIIYLLGIATILDVDLEEAVLKKVEKNKNREYKNINGVHVRIKDI